MSRFCDNEELLAAYLDRRLTEGERRAYEKHIAECPRCLAALLSAKRELDEMTGEPSPDRPVGHGERRGVSGGASGGRRAARMFRMVPRPASGARARRPIATGLAVCVAAALVVTIGALLLSPAWDPALRATRAEINAILSRTQLGALRLADGPRGPFEPPATLRGAIGCNYRRLDRLEDTLNELVQRYPGTSEIHRLLGHLHVAADHLDRAEVAFRRAARLAPDDGRALNDRAVIAYRRGSIDSAFAHLREARRLTDVPVEVSYNLGILYRAAGDTIEANRCFEAYIREDPASPWARRARELIRE